MLIAANTADERATTAHRAKLAYVYVRQSSLNQVKQHQESTELQYQPCQVGGVFPRPLVQGQWAGPCGVTTGAGGGSAFRLCSLGRQGWCSA